MEKRCIYSITFPIFFAYLKCLITHKWNLEKQPKTTVLQINAAVHKTPLIPKQVWRRQKE